MPNWCTSRCGFFCADEHKNELARLYKNLSAVLETPSEVKNGFELGWLGKVAIHHGLDWQEYSCRGTIEELGEFEPGDNFFTLDSETAWAPTVELWEAVIAQYEGVSFIYIAEEPGSDIFVNTDVEGRYFTDRYLIDIFGNGPIPESWYEGKEKPDCLEIREYFENFDDIADYCADFTGKQFGTFEELQNYFAEIFGENDGIHVGVHEFTDS